MSLYKSSRVYGASWCSSGQWDSTQTLSCVHCACPQANPKTVIQKSLNGGDLKIIGLKPWVFLNDGFLGLSVYVRASGMHFQPVPTTVRSHLRGGKARSFHVSRTSGAQALRKLLNVLRYLEKGRSGNTVSPICHTNQNISFL